MTYILYKKTHGEKVRMGEHESLDTLAKMIAHAAVLTYRESGRTPEFHIETSELPHEGNAIYPASSYAGVLSSRLVNYEEAKQDDCG